ncbi:hypothetical protein Kosp01_11670 [Kocuria sp. NBRC 114282]|nr:hypothetical protein Kosp01_11670 [Kocuria sp. NBRC 114282]
MLTVDHHAAPSPGSASAPRRSRPAQAGSRLVTHAHPISADRMRICHEPAVHGFRSPQRRQRSVDRKACAGWTRSPGARERDADMEEAPDQMVRGFASV